MTQSAEALVDPQILRQTLSWQAGEPIVVEAPPESLEWLSAGAAVEVVEVGQEIVAHVELTARPERLRVGIDGGGLFIWEHDPTEVSSGVRRKPLGHGIRLELGAPAATIVAARIAYGVLTVRMRGARGVASLRAPPVMAPDAG